MGYRPGLALSGWTSSALLLLAGLHLISEHPARAQLQYPLQGQEGEDARPLAPAVNVTALLDRITRLDTSNNIFGAIWWIVLTWRDAGAGGAVAARTGPLLGGDGAAPACARPCDSSALPDTGCCDTIWLPHIELPNMVMYDQDQFPRYRINANASSGLVTWSTRVIGDWYAPLDFRAYPFDHQHLVVELSIADSQSPGAGLRWEQVAKLQNTAHTKGMDLSGWRLKSAKGKLYDSRSCYEAYGVATPRYDPAGDDARLGGAAPAAYVSVRLADRHFPTSADTTSSADIVSVKPAACSWGSGGASALYPEGRALYGPMVLVADVMLKRESGYYVLTNLVPTLIIALVVFVTFCMPCDALGERLGVTVSMFLSLTALQFVYDFPPANYLNALQMVVLAAYVLMGFAVLESLLVHRLVTLSRAVRNRRTMRTKYKSLLARHVLFMRPRHAARSESADGRRAKAGRAGDGAETPQSVGTRSGGAAEGPRGGAVAEGACGGAAAEGGRAQARDATVSIVLCEAGEVRGAAGLREWPAAEGCVALPEQAQIDPHKVEADAAAAIAAGPPAPGVCGPQAPLRRGYGGWSAAEGRGPGGGATPRGDHASFSGAFPPFHHHHPPNPLLSAIRAGSLGRSARGRPPPGASFRSGTSGAESLPSALGAPRPGALQRLRRLLATPAEFHRHIKLDEDFAVFVAARIDKWCGLAGLLVFSVCIGVMLWVQTRVGDHKLMLGDPPGNM